MYKHVILSFPFNSNKEHCNKKNYLIVWCPTWWEIAYCTKRFADLIFHAIYIFKPHLVCFIYFHYVQFAHCRQQIFGISVITDCARVYIGNQKCHVTSTANEYLSFLDYRNYDK